VLSFTPRPLHYQGKRPGTHRIGGWVLGLMNKGGLVEQSRL